LSSAGEARRAYESDLLARNPVAYVMDRLSRRWITSLRRKDIEVYHDYRLRRAVRYVWDNSPFYKRKLKRAGVYPEDIRGRADLHKIPTTSKNGIRSSQHDHPPFGDILSVPPDRIITAATTTGTTGDPVRVPFTYNDIVNSCNATHAEAIAEQTMGAVQEIESKIGSMNTVTQLASNHSLWKSSVSLLTRFQYPGDSVIMTGTGNTEMQVEIARDIGSEIFAMTPSYALYMGEVIKRMGVSVKNDMKVKVLTLFGEPGGSIASVRSRIVESWDGVVETRDLAGGVEAGLGCDCFLHEGIHLDEDLMYHEVLDESGEGAVTDGEVGESTVTWLTREGFPLLRYRTGDLIKLDSTTCGCGRTTRRAVGGIMGRSDDMLKVKGLKLFPSTIDEVMKRIQGLTGEFLIVVGKGKMEILDEVTIKVEYLKGYEQSKLEDLRTKVAREIQAVISFSPHLELVPEGSLGRFVHKAQRILDLRKKDAIEAYDARMKLQEMLR